MTTMAMTAEPIIKTAMSRIGLEDKTDDLLGMMDEIELDMHLKISMEQADRGEFVTIEEIKKEMQEKFANGYFTKENARKRIKEKYGNEK